MVEDRTHEENPERERGADVTEPRKMFESAIKEMVPIGGFAIAVSAALKGRPTTRQGELASMVFGRMCAHGRSIGALVQSGMFDHSAIMAIARMLVDGMTMHSYLREPVSEQLWQLRYSVMKLHDTAARIKFVRAWWTSTDYADLIAGRDSLIQEIRQNPEFQTLNGDQQTHLLSGEAIFASGMRRAARSAGWSEDMFISTYNYFSAHIHAAPMSYWRMRQHDVDYLSPGPMQFATAAMAIGVGAACLRRVALRELDDRGGGSGGKDGEFLLKLRQEDRDCTVFAGNARNSASTPGRK